ncbi:lasso peptide biosynthesis B2 protein [Novosphingobium resinovorum]|nr:lasso peptide biosynthesis B2 protein [Novosphingobium resinovorum]
MNSIIVRLELQFCQIDGCYVFLDLNTQRYFLIANDAAARFRRYLNGASTGDDIEWLIGNRLICPTEEASQIIRPSVVAPAAESMMDRPLPRADALFVLQIILGQRAARRQLRRLPFKMILQNLCDRKDVATKATRRARGADASAPNLLPIVAAFRASERISNSIDQCLPRGIALFTLLRRYGFAPNMVIGVTLPFAAHCWIQVGDHVVSDSLDRVRSFKPILAL